MESIGNNSDSKFFLLTQDELTAIHREAAEIGAKAALEKIDSEKKKIIHASKDKRLRNTKLLLENYHMLKLSATDSVYVRGHIKESITDVLLNMMNLYEDGVIVESIKKSAERTIIMVEHIETMVKLYKTYCYQSDWKDKRRYEVIYNLYIRDDVKSVKQVAKEQHVSNDTIYSDIKIAIQRLSALIFGIDGLKIT